MEVQVARIEDVDGWIRLVETVKDQFPGLDIDTYQAVLLKRIEQQSALLVKKDDAVLGALLFSKTKNELQFLAVHPDYRQQGIATALIHRMFSLLPKAATVTVITYREDDTKGTAARKLYERMGFVPGALVMEFGYPCQVFSYVTI